MSESHMADDQTIPPSVRTVLLNEFQQAWQAGVRPSVKAFLNRAPFEERTDLLTELLTLELEFRRRTGDTPELQEYVSTLPDYEQMLVKYFERQPGSGVPTEPPDPDATVIPELNESFYRTVAPGLSDTGPASLESSADFARIGDYEVLSEIARGGMGVVYKVRHLRLGRVAAVKMILSRGFESKEQVQRFLAEADAVANLNHVGIVSLFEVGEHAGQHFFAMEYIDGKSLWQVVRTNPLEPKLAARIMRDVSDAMNYAHQSGVIHRDLKPQNILLDAGEQPRITDFGLAKRESTDASLTRTGDVMGTASYMPPEQALGRMDQVDAISDVYSLGATLYCLLTGRPPFQAANVMETLKQVVDIEPPSPRLINPAIDRDLETICLKCLRKDKTGRYSSAEELAGDLGRFLRNEPIHARPAGHLERSWRWCRRNPIAAVLITSLASFLILAMIFVSYRAQLIVVAEQLKNTNELRRISDYYGQINKVREASANPTLGWTWNAREQLSLAARAKPDDAAPEELRTLMAEVLTRPDLKHVADLAPNVDASVIAFSPDGSRLAVAERKNAINCSVYIYRVLDQRLLETCTYPTLANSVEKLVSFDAKYQEGTRSLAWSPDCRWLVAGTRFGKLVRWDLNQQQPVPVIWQGHEESIDSVAFSPDGSVCYSICKSLKRWQASEKWAEIPSPRNDYFSFSVAANGKWLAAVAAPHRQFHFLDSATLKVIPSWPAIQATRSEFSPDSRFIATTEQESRIVIREARSGTEISSWTVKENSVPTIVNQLAFSADGLILIGLDARQRLHFWEITSGLETMPPITSAADVTPWFSINPKGGWLALTTKDRFDTTKLFEFRQSTQVFALPQIGVVRGLDISPSAGSLAITTHTVLTHRNQEWNQVNEWDISRRQPANETRMTFQSLRPVLTASAANTVWNPTGDCIAWSTERCGVLISSAKGRKGQTGFVTYPHGKSPTDIDPASIASVAAAPAEAIAADPDGEKVPVTQLSSEIVVPPRAAHSRWLWSVVGSIQVPDRLLGDDGFEINLGQSQVDRARVYDAEIPNAMSQWYEAGLHLTRLTGDAPAPYPERFQLKSLTMKLVLDRLVLVPWDHDKKTFVECEYGQLMWAPDGQRLWGMTHNQKQLTAWSRDDLSIKATWSNQASTVTAGSANMTSLCVGQRKILCGSRNGFVTVLPVSDGVLKPDNNFAGPGGEVCAAVLGPDETWAVLATRTGKIEIRSIPDGAILGEIANLDVSVNSLALAGQALLLAAGCDDGFIRIYDVKSLSETPLKLRLKSNLGSLASIRFHPDGERLAAYANGSMKVMLWNLVSLLHDAEMLLNAGATLEQL